MKHPLKRNGLLILISGGRNESKGARFQMLPSFKAPLPKQNPFDGEYEGVMSTLNT